MDGQGTCIRRVINEAKVATLTFDRAVNTVRINCSHMHICPASSAPIDLRTAQYLTHLDTDMDVLLPSARLLPDDSPSFPALRSIAVNDTLTNILALLQQSPNVRTLNFTPHVLTHNGTPLIVHGPSSSPLQLPSVETITWSSAPISICTPNVRHLVVLNRIPFHLFHPPTGFIHTFLHTFDCTTSNDVTTDQLVTILELVDDIEVMKISSGHIGQHRSDFYNQLRRRLQRDYFWKSVQTFRHLEVAFLVPNTDQREYALLRAGAIIHNELETEFHASGLLLGVRGPFRSFDVHCADAWNPTNDNNLFEHILTMRVWKSPRDRPHDTDLVVVVNSMSVFEDLIRSGINISIHAYGQRCPYRAAAGYDVIIEVEVGLIHITREPNRPPSKVGLAATNIHTGLYAHSAIMAALPSRQQKGEGVWIDCNLFETQIAGLENIACNYLKAGTEVKRHGTAHPSVVPYQVFPYRDGFLIISQGNNK
ncbi:hypothetical protein C8R43DRAFT_1141822 [Mycena crocata]|nr:hypothetical protein C8R43DRAFT_1143167 [Mycena crocata]KAJ7093618.1 hypothetical protein C8R43DRAFT_1141822 [Mycena crocata]